MKDLVHVNDIVVESFEALAEKLEEHQKKLSVNPNYIKDGVVISVNALEKIKNLKSKYIINVDLEIPRKFYEELRDGRVVRVGGVLKHPTKNVFKKHLGEIKPSVVRKLSKATNWAAPGLDVLGQVLVDQKLGDILGIVKEIDLKLEAQNRGAFLSAITQARKLCLASNKEIERQELFLVLNDLNHCEHLFTEIYKAKWKEYNKLDNMYRSSLLTNTSELKKICKIGKAIPGDLEIIALCKIAQIRLREMSEQYVRAKEESFGLVSFLCEEIGNYKDNFDDYAMSIKELRHQKLFIEFWKMCTWYFKCQYEEKKFQNIKDEFLEPHERVEFLLNIALCVPLGVTEYLPNGS